ncbi:hypothetical protein BABINDRAFT_35394 [Babjeviella inositovora NRRL Y-12698]|uniref:candidapepsin n=1 Tax=Babjeviella inositovora NRRL Y-12698 TaxID=984486 RepID=A0A1E3QR01_9ASCO|nr:uncharacterized protein BABINDRAFT_35394 [Babjeviella inositovora NRRL Y-12698]ODQ80101.1 hypothetical protein BABINDRAFT_35394 [Babjeviella inositovora NRRL Y-12698]
MLAEAAGLTDGVFLVDFSVHKGETAENAIYGGNTPRLVPRAVSGVDTLNLINENTFYLANVSLGSNQQKVGVLLDTGSSDLWVQGNTNPYCKAGTAGNGAVSKAVSAADQFDCSVYGTFNTATSTTYHNNGTAFSITYGDGTFAKGTWGQDTVNVAGLLVSGVNLAVANNADSSVGVFGIGLAGNEASNSGNTPFIYDNFPVQLKKKGLIKKTLYSLYLNSATSALGNVLFGGVDHAKHYGNLVPLPLVNVYPQYYSSAVSFFVTLAGVGYNNQAVSTGLISALLDSGTTLTYLPKAVVSNVASKLGYTYSSSAQAYSGPCTGAFTSKSLSFLFAGVTINSPITNFLEQAYYSDGSVAPNVCFLGLIPSTDTYILGDSFLRAAYVVYDLEALQVYLAQAIPNATAQDIVAVTSTIPPGTLVQQTATTF